MRPPVPSQISESVLFNCLTSVDTRGENPGQLPYLDHAEPFARWWNTIGNPLWSFAPWFPANDSAWPVDNAPVFNRYWIDARTQWLWHSALPGGEASATRTTLLSEPCGQGELDTWIGERFGCGPTSWLGICRFESLGTEPQVLTLSATAPVVGIEGTSLSTGSTGYTATPPASSTSVAVRLDVAQFANRPFLALAVRRMVRSVFTGATTARLEAVAEDGTVTVLADPLVSGTWYTRPRGLITTFAGSWAQDYGAGLIVDQGADMPTLGGLSAATMADGERRQTWNLHPAKQTRFLIWRFTVPALGVVSLNFPEFRSEGAWRVITETAGQFGYLQAQGAGLRWDASFWNRATNQFIAAGSPPLPASFGIVNPAAGDAFCHRRETWQGMARDDGLDTEIAAIYDSDEYTLRAHLWRNPLGRQTTHSFAALGGDGFVRLIAVSSLREVPPLALLPHQGRNANFERWGTASNQVWHWSCEPRRLAANPNEALAGDAAQVVVDSSVWTTTELWQGWAISWHNRPVNNRETGFIRAAGRDLATVRPWHGWFGSLRWVPKVGRPLYAVGPALEHLLLVVGDGAGASVTPNASAPPLWATLDMPTPASGGGASLQYDWRRPYVLASDGGQVTLHASADGGQTWSATMILATGTNPALVCTRTGRAFAYYLRGGSLFVRWAAPDMVTWAAEAACGPTGLSDSPLDAAESVGPNGAWRVILVGRLATGEIAQWASSDGINFS